MDDERLLNYHNFTREHGVNRAIYFLMRCLLQPFFLVYFRLSRIGREHAKVRGPLIVVSNHRSFLDPFVIGATLPWSRPLHYMAKMELFDRRWQGWILNRLGAYPVRRGQSDEDVLITSRAVLKRGGAICIFPEGTRITSGSLGRPKRGFGRMALESGAAVLPVAVHGTEHVRNGVRVRPRKVKVRAGRALTFPRTDDPSPQLANSVGARIWPVIELQWEWLGGLPPLRKAAVIGAGSWGTAVAVLLARGGLDVQLGCRTSEQAEKLNENRSNERYLAGVRLPEGIAIKRASEIELAGMDLVCLAVPSKSLPAAVGSIGDRVGERSAVLMLSKGLVAPMGALPSEYVGERVRARAIACLGGPAHAKEAVSGTAALVLGSDDLDLRSQLGEVFDEAGLVCERTTDVTGVEMAGVAKNAAALAAAAAESHGMNAAGIATTEVWRECLEYAELRGGRPETFSGLAGIGDLTATILAPRSRNRRAGELLGKGIPAGQIPGKIGQASEGLDSVPLIAETVGKSGVEAPGLDGLARLIAEEISPAEWMAGLRRAERARRAAA
ncbi:MAG: 1-acyl-sn-glycerol-3-phosphate acyltransferase [Actinomycetota bacterium]|nr:1-acyl-sn-glycerol-3-phosphate acyltransferase [Actinomycetota bacterium]